MMMADRPDEAPAGAHLGVRAPCANCTWTNKLDTPTHGGGGGALAACRADLVDGLQPG